MCTKSNLVFNTKTTSLSRDNFYFASSYVAFFSVLGGEGGLQLASHGL